MNLSLCCNKEIIESLDSLDIQCLRCSKCGRMIEEKLVSKYYIVWGDDDLDLDRKGFESVDGPYSSIQECKQKILEKRLAEYEMSIKYDSYNYYCEEEPCYRIFLEVLPQTTIEEDHHLKTEYDIRKNEISAKYHEELVEKSKRIKENEDKAERDLLAN